MSHYCCPMPEFNWMLLDSFNIIDLQLLLTLLCDSCNTSCSQLTSALRCWRLQLRRNEVDSFVLQQLDCCAPHTQCTNALCGAHRAWCAHHTLVHCVVHTVRGVYTTHCTSVWCAHRAWCAHHTLVHCVVHTVRGVYTTH